VQKSAREVLGNKHLIRVELIFAAELIGGVAVFGCFGFTDVELLLGTVVVLAELAIEQLVFYAAIRLIDCDNFEEGSAGQLLISGRNFGQDFIHRLVSRALHI
jgi:hypothetical protein